MNLSKMTRIQQEYRSAMGRGDVPAMMVALRKIESLRTSERLHARTAATRRILSQVRLLP
jgi:hypothetical protein